MLATGFAPAELDKRSRASGTTIGTLRDAIPKELHAIDPQRAWITLAVAFVRVAVSLALLALIRPAWGPALAWQIPALGAAWLFAGWCFTGIFVLGHDCGHMAFSERRWVNVLVGHICLSPVFTGFHNWRIWHNYHHAKTQLRREDPDWAEKMLTRAEYDAAPIGDKAHVRLGFGTPLGMLVGFWVGMFRRTFMKTLAPQIPLSRTAERELLMSSVLMVLASGSLTLLLYRAGGAWMVLKYYWVPSFIAAAHGAMLTYLHHTSADALVFDKADWTPFRGQVVSTFNVRFPRFVEALWFDINIHLPHHLAPRIPWYQLKAATEAIRRVEPAWVQERRFSFAYLRASWARPLLARATSGDHFEMAAFDIAREPASGVHAAPANIPRGPASGWHAASANIPRGPASGWHAASAAEDDEAHDAPKPGLDASAAG
jgi:omega-6 fatty acid desaturase (delta-12 desaturase)